MPDPGGCSAATGKHAEALNGRLEMSNSKYSLTPSAIKYLLALLELCQPNKGARCMDIAEYLQVTKPSVHSMICNLCQSGLAEKKKYGAVFLTEQGHA